MPHLTETQVQSFVDGTLDEATAVRLAVHLDTCPRCTARVEAADPLAEAWRDIPRPQVPDDVLDF